MDDAPSPLVPPDCDLRDFPRIMIDVNRLFGSTFNAKASAQPLAWMVGHKLWYKSWHQVPAASLPDDDAELCYLAELGFDKKTWGKVKALAMHGWVKCNDGRLYHPVVAEEALSAWQRKISNRYGAECARIKKHNQRNPDANVPTPSEAEFVAGGMKKIPLPKPDCPSGQAKVSLGTNANVPREKPSKGQGQGQLCIIEEPYGSSRRSADAPPEPDPVEVAFGQYVAMRKELVPSARSIELSPKRRRALATRLNEIGGLPGWQQVLADIRGSPFLRGDTSRNGFVAEIDWLLKPENLTKVREGNYHEQRAAHADGATGVRGSPIDALNHAIVAAGLGGQ